MTTKQMQRTRCTFGLSWMQWCLFVPSLSPCTFLQQEAVHQSMPADFRRSNAGDQQSGSLRLGHLTLPRRCCALAYGLERQLQRPVGYLASGG